MGVSAFRKDSFMAPEFNRFSALPDVILIKPHRFEDARGFFSETYNSKTFANGGVADVFVQDNHSLSGPAGTLRGLHFQRAPKGQAKLVRCLRGRMVDVAVDIRPTSPTFCQHVSIELSAASGWQVYIPDGFAHGFCTLEPDTEVAYKTTAHYDVALDAGIRFDDADLAIDWPMAPDALTLSARDAGLPSLSEMLHAAGARAQ
jgi:dTDP-4-dehydrorhamnose 3,5-epimerase